MTLFQSRHLFFCVPGRPHCTTPHVLAGLVEFGVLTRKRTTAETGAPRIAVVPDFRLGKTKWGRTTGHSLYYFWTGFMTGFMSSCTGVWPSGVPGITLVKPWEQELSMPQCRNRT